MKKSLIYFKKWKITKKKYTGTRNNTSSCFMVKSLCNLKILESNYIAVYTLLKKVYKKKAYFNCGINKQKLITIRSLGMRMGKGKGSKKKKIYLLNKGDIFIEIQSSSIRSIKDFKLFFKIINKKLPFYTQGFYKKNLYLNL